MMSDQKDVRARRFAMVRFGCMFVALCFLALGCRTEGEIGLRSGGGPEYAPSFDPAPGEAEEGEALPDASPEATGLPDEVPAEPSS